MRRFKPIMLMAPLMLVTACGDGAERGNAVGAGNGAQSEATAENDAQAIAQSEAAAGSLLDASGQAIGTVQVSDGSDGVSLKIDARGLPPGVHGIHVHTTGKCEGPKFESAGPHWNPDSKMHGSENPQGPHRGDLPNVTVAADGTLKTTVTLAGANLAETNDGDGSALVLHAKADDYKTDPSGNSGDRLFCAVIGQATG